MWMGGACLKILFCENNRVNFARQGMIASLFILHTFTRTYITSYHGRRLCKPFNICLNNAAVFHKPGVDRLIPELASCAVHPEREISGIFIFFLLALISFPPFLSALHFLYLTSSPSATLLIIQCSYIFLHVSVYLALELTPKNANEKVVTWTCSV